MSESTLVPASEYETAISASASQARAMVEARFLVALKRPRDIDEVRTRILRDCKRPRFAEVARYRLPRGAKSIEGPSIRFAEVALRSMGNVDVQSPTLYEDEEKRIVRVSVTDLEVNATYSTDLTITKTIERRNPREGAQIIGERETSTGDRVFIVRATDEELVTKQGAMVSKAIRTNGLRLIPGDIVEDAMDEVVKTLRQADAQDPDTARKRIADAFASVGVNPANLREYLSHPLEQCSPAEITELRAIFSALKDGETTWTEVMRVRGEESGVPTPPARESSILDEKDVAKVRKTIATRRNELGFASLTTDEIEMRVLKQWEVSAFTTIAKSDLPALLACIKSWTYDDGEPAPEETAGA